MVLAALLALTATCGPITTSGQLGTQPTEVPAPAAPTPLPTRRAPTKGIRPDNFQYLGAFRLPAGEERPQTFAYGGNAMTFNPPSQPGADAPEAQNLVAPEHPSAFVHQSQSPPSIIRPSLSPV
jgi:hypothetical protein